MSYPGLLGQRWEPSHASRELTLIQARRQLPRVAHTQFAVLQYDSSMLSLNLPAAFPDPSVLTRELLLAVLVLAAMVSDLRTMRIPNWLTFGGAAAGLALAALAGEALTALQGFGLGLAMLLPLWLVRVLGAGDVKLMAMVGAFLGFPEIAGAALMVFIAGGVLAIGYSLWLRQTGRMLRNVQQALVTSAFAISAGMKPQLAAMPSIGKLPYGVGICVGTLAWLVYRHLA
jgi:prepilin peptidase CpaA